MVHMTTFVQGDSEKATPVDARVADLHTGRLKYNITVLPLEGQLFE